jgi:hypothetical protein
MSGSSVTIQHNKNMTEANAQTFYDLALDRQKVAVLQITVIVITVLLVDEIGVPGENHLPVASH